MVAVPEKGVIERCITVNLTGLNKFVRQPAEPTRLSREPVPNIRPCTSYMYFTSLGSCHGYGQVALDDKSAKFTTCIAPWNVYHSSHIVMGLISTSDKLDYRGDEGRGALKTYTKSLKTKISMTRTGHSVSPGLVRLCNAKHKTTLNREKFMFAAPQVDCCRFQAGLGKPYLTTLCQPYGIPNNNQHTDVHSFLRLDQQFDAFSPHLANLLCPLYSLQLRTP